jgi:hypothetical protein
MLNSVVRLWYYGESVARPQSRSFCLWSSRQVGGRRRLRRLGHGSVHKSKVVGGKFVQPEITCVSTRKRGFEEQAKVGRESNKASKEPPFECQTNEQQRRKSLCLTLRPTDDTI